MDDWSFSAHGLVAAGDPPPNQPRPVTARLTRARSFMDDFHLFEDERPVKPSLRCVLLRTCSVLFRRLAAHRVGWSCPGFSIPSRAVRRPDESGSLPGQDRCRARGGSALNAPPAPGGGQGGGGELRGP